VRRKNMATRNSIAFLGVGNMGAAIVNGILQSGIFQPKNIILCDMFEEKCRPFVEKGCAYTASLAQAAEMADTVLLAVKPQQIDEVFGEIRPCISGKLVLSIAAGVPIARIAENLPGASVVRVMPNTPLLVGEGVSALCRDEAVSLVSEEDFALAFRIFSASGTAFELKEEQINPVTALTSSSIAYFARFIGDMYVWALENGFPANDDTMSMVCRSAIGTAQLLLKTDFDPHSLEKAVTSKGGTTEQAMKVFTEEGLDQMIPKAMDACRRRADELAGK